MPGTAVAGTLSGRGPGPAEALPRAAAGRASKVIITSRSDEAWLGITNRFAIPLGGLQGEERWDYCEAILRDLGLTIDRKDAELVS